MKKLLALCMTLVMLAVPLASMAASPEELMLSAFEAGQDLQLDLSLELPPYMTTSLGLSSTDVELLTKTNFSMIFGHNMGRAAVSYDGTELVNVSAGINDAALLLNSNLLGEKTVAFGFSETMKYMKDYIVPVLASELNMSEDSIDLVWDAMIDGTETQIGDFSLSNIDLDAVTAEYLPVLSEYVLAQFDPECLTAVTDWMQGIYSAEVPADILEIMADTDAASCQYTLTLSPATVEEGASAIVQLLVSNDIFMDSMCESMSMSKTELTEELQQFPAQIRSAMDAIGDLVILIQKDADGGIVYASTDIMGIIGIVYHCQTIAGAKTCAFDMTYNGSSVMSCNVVLDTADMMPVGFHYAAEGSITLDITVERDESEKKASRDLTIDINSIASDAHIIFELDASADTQGCSYALSISVPSASIDKLASLVLKVSAVDAIPALTEDGAVHPLSMTGDELTTWGEEVQSAITLAVFNFISVVPDGAEYVQYLMGN